MITTNAIQRTFHIKVGDSTGTCFTIDIDGKQYIVTAKHVVSNIIDTANISIFHDNQWKLIQVTLVGHCENDIDISVLSTNFQISPILPLEPSMGGLTYGQDSYFLGFPYGMTGEIGQLNRDFPLPFVKKGIVSCIQNSPDNVKIVYLDGLNNPGFSGGPVIFKEQNQINFKVGAVISGYRYNEEPIYQGSQQVPLAYRYNTGIIISYSIEHAVDLIRINPIGYILQEQAVIAQQPAINV